MKTFVWFLFVTNAVIASMRLGFMASAKFPITREPATIAFHLLQTAVRIGVAVWAAFVLLNP